MTSGTNQISRSFGSEAPSNGSTCTFGRTKSSGAYNKPQHTLTHLYVECVLTGRSLASSDPSYNSIQISGPTLAFLPETTNAWWTGWLAQISGNNTVPDQYAYHLEGARTDPGNDLQHTNASLRALLHQYGLPERQVNINEYAELSEQIPSGYAWWISRLERYNAIGLLGNWQGGTTLHDLFADLLTKVANPNNYTATDYAMAAGYPVYQYYASNMTGRRVNTTGSTDRQLDVYATVGKDRVRLLAGVKVNTGTWQITVDNMAAAGYPPAGNVSIDTWGFDGTSVFQVVGPPSFRNTAVHAYSGNTLSFPIFQTDNHTAWAFEFDNLRKC
jgi:hypothetical protein